MDLEKNRSDTNKRIRDLIKHSEEIQDSFKTNLELQLREQYSSENALLEEDLRIAKTRLAEADSKLTLIMQKKQSMTETPSGVGTTNLSVQLSADAEIEIEKLNRSVYALKNDKSSLQNEMTKLEKNLSDARKQV